MGRAEARPSERWINFAGDSERNFSDFPGNNVIRHG
jgi:hypothetical protein